MNDTVLLLYRCDAWMSTSSMELIGVFTQDSEVLSEILHDELMEIAHGSDFDPKEWDVRKCFGKWVKKELQEARERQVQRWMDYFFDNDQTPTLRTNLYMESRTLNEAA